MARMPAAQWLGEHSPRRAMDRYDLVIVHTIVGYAPVHTPHFSTRWSGKIYQSRDTRYQSAVSLEANDRSIGIENEDRGPEYGGWSGSNVPRFTDDQAEAIARIIVWSHETHGIPIQLAPNSKPTSRGVAYHRMGIDGNFGTFDYPGRVEGGEEWSESFGKVCPGDKRIRQLIEEIIPRARVLAGLQEEDDMPTLEQVFNTKVIPNKSAPGGEATSKLTLATCLSNMEATQDVDHGLLVKISAQLGAVNGTVAHLVKALAAQADVEPDALVAAVRQAAEDGANAALAAGVVDVDVTVRNDTGEEVTQ